MKAVIAGGSGLIGQALTKELTKNGYEVVILSRNPERTGAKIADAEVIHWDGRTQGDWVNHVNGADAVINLAGASIAGDNVLKMRWTAKRKTQIHRSRMDAGKAITEAIQSVENKPGILVQSSAVGIYGPLDDEIVDENHPLADDYLANVCRDWENSTKGVEAIGVRRVVIRTGLVFSKDGGIFPLLRLPFSLFIGGPLGSGKQFLSWIHIDDVAGAIRYLIENQNAVGTYNLTSPDPVSNKTFSQEMGKSMRRPALLPVPSFTMKIALGEVSTLALDGQRVVPSRLLESGYQFKFIKLSNALDDLLQSLQHFRHSFTVKSEKEEVSAFHEDTKVLKQLTPFPIFVQFKQVEPVGEGTRAIFTLWFGPIPVNWEAVHHDFDHGNGFADSQEKGPFDYWFHKHSFLSVNATKTEVVDEITAAFGKGLFSWVVSRFMWLTLPILFSFRGWQTKRLIEKKNISY